MESELTKLLSLRHIKRLMLEQAKSITVLRADDGSVVNSCMTSVAMERIKPKLMDEGEVLIVSLGLFAAIKYNGYVYTLTFTDK